MASLVLASSRNEAAENAKHSLVGHHISALLGDVFPSLGKGLRLPRLMDDARNTLLHTSCRGVPEGIFVCGANLFFSEICVVAYGEIDGD